MRWLAVVLLISGCVSSSSIECSNGQLCPAGTVCRPLPGITNAPDTMLCAAQADLDACTGKTDGDPCSHGVCHDGVCFDASCGNGYTDPGEGCDDHNNAAGDGCSADCKSNETCGNGALDGVAFEQCDDGNRVGGDGCDDACRPELPVWNQIDLDSITTRRTAMTFDTARGLGVVFGGLDGTGVVLAETWLWNGTGWARANPRGAPNARLNAAMAYDVKHHQVVLFGGSAATSGSNFFADTWVWDGHDWKNVTPAIGPSRREGATMAYDARRERIVLFGGHFRAFDGQTKVYGDTWEWDGAAWTLITTATLPEPRWDAAMTYDPLRDAIVMFGGSNNFADGSVGTLVAKTWSYYGGDWHGVTPATQPSSRFGARMAWDPVSHTSVLFGGNTGAADLQDTWQWSGTAWTPYGGGTKPAPRNRFGFATDTAHGVLVAFGGSAPESPPTTWQWTGSTWIQVTPPLPGRQQVIQMAYDPLRGRSVMIDSRNGSQTWETDGGGFALYLTSPGSDFRFNQGLAFDQARGRILVFGGQDSTVTDPNDLWSWTGSTWSLVATSNPAPGREDSPIAYDTARDRLVVFGGFDTTGLSTLLGDTWELDGMTWTQRTPAHTPSPRAFHMMAYDPIRKNVVLFGGEMSITGEYDGQTWTWDGTDWTQHSPAMSPPARLQGTLAWNPRRRVLTLFGGLAAGTLADTWEWDGTTWAKVDVSTTPPPRTSISLFPTLDGGIAVFGGGILAGPNGPTDTWRLTWEGTTPRETCVAPIDLDGDGLAGCADPDCFAVCTPMCPPGVECDPAAPHCGDGTCNTALETCRMCPGDCGACPLVCGDSFCDSGETAQSCPGDCH